MPSQTNPVDISSTPFVFFATYLFGSAAERGSEMHGLSRAGTAQGWRTRAIAITAVVVLALLAPDLATAAPTAPRPTTSRYMKTTDPNVLSNEGCNQAQAGEAGRIVLFFGQPWVQAGTYGTIIFGSNTFRSISQIEAAVKGWLGGYWGCTPVNGPKVLLAVGTSNFRGETTSGHGAAWARMVNRIEAWIKSPPSYESQETARGASDMETAWNTVANTRAWVNGYASAYTGTQYYYNFGDAGGCPPYGSCLNGWTQADVYYVSYGAAPAWPLPQIYCEVCYSGDTNGGQSRQWYRMALWAKLNAGGMYILGSLTQWAAAGNCCTNTPAQGWSQLWDDLNGDSRTAQSLETSSDITKVN
jgi:hypothetical protein